MMQNPRLLLVLLLLLVGGLATFLFVRNRQPLSTLGAEARSFAVADTAALTKIFLADRRGNQTTLVRTSKGSWQVNGQFNARPDLMATLMETLHGLEVRQPVSDKARTNVLKTMAVMQTKVELYAGSDLVRSYYVGDNSADMLGTFMLLAGSQTPYVMHLPGLQGFLNTRYAADPAEWRNRSLFGVAPNAVARLQVAPPQGAAKGFLIVDGGQGKLLFTPTASPDDATPAQPAQGLLKSYIKAWADLQVETWAKRPALYDSLTTQGTPVAVLTLLPKGGKPIIAHFYQKASPNAPAVAEGLPTPTDEDRLWVVLPATKALALVQHRLADPLFLTADGLMRINARGAAGK